jgi:V/A-type H+/Na+-transporting ATPase subunit I
MTFRPSQAAWFETYTPRNQTVFAIQTLANTGIVELSHDLWSSANIDTSLIQANVKAFNHLAAKHKAFLPEKLIAPDINHDSPEQLSEEALSLLRKWSADLLRLQRNLARTEKTIIELKKLKSLLMAIPDHDLDFKWLDKTSDILYKKLFCCPPDQFSHPSGKEFFTRVFKTTDHDFLLVLGTPEHINAIDATATLVNCHEFHIPGWLEKAEGNKIHLINQHLKEMFAKRHSMIDQLEAHQNSVQIKKALAEVRLLSWFLNNLCGLSKDHKLCHLVGWTSADSADSLQKAFNEAGIEAKITLAHQPEDQLAPVSCDQPWWIRPFSFFVNLLGTPDRDEIDPSPLLAVVVPLLFGYMFPDLGHGLILLVAGFLLKKRAPAFSMLIPCGITASAFGVLFGDVFGHHDIIEPLWVNALQNPLQVLIVPMIFGTIIITLGSVFSGIESYWRRDFVKWLLTEMAVLLLYLDLIVSLFWLEALWASLPLLLWYFVGSLITCKKSPLYCLGYSAGSLLESQLRLVMNSISFIRVGAFALAHAGSSYAANEIAYMIDNPFFFIVFLIIGHAFIIILEGMIVFVQTSRLILFEFFLRFLKAEGRVFHPMHRLE